jgi:hypothetical protein
MSTANKSKLRLYLLLTGVLVIIVSVLMMNLLVNGKADDPVSAPVSDGATVVPGTEVPAVEPSAEPLDNTQQAITIASGVVMRDPEPAPTFDPGSGPTGGCVLGYGENGQCLTVVPPSHAEHPDHHDGTDISTFWTCSEVTQYFADGIVVNGAAKNVDRLGLDSNNDGVACGPGDTGN